MLEHIVNKTRNIFLKPEQKIVFNRFFIFSVMKDYMAMIKSFSDIGTTQEAILGEFITFRSSEENSRPVENTGISRTL
jgi:hypothetical protein